MHADRSHAACLPPPAAGRAEERFAFAVINVIVTAVGGENSESGAGRFEADGLTHRPDIVTIDYALNDRGLGLAKAERAWRRMIELALSKNVKVILLTPTHDVLTLRTGNPEWSVELPKHAEQVRRLAAEYGLALADSYEAFNRYIAAGGEVIDLLSHVNHPNRLGHQLVRRAAALVPGPIETSLSSPSSFPVQSESNRLLGYWPSQFPCVKRGCM